MSINEATAVQMQTEIVTTNVIKTNFYTDVIAKSLSGRLRNTKKYATQ